MKRGKKKHNKNSKKIKKSYKFVNKNYIFLILISIILILILLSFIYIAYKDKQNLEKGLPTFGIWTFIFKEFFGITVEETYPSYFLDIGTFNDNNPNNQQFIELNPKVSIPLTEGSIDYRELSRNSLTKIRFNSSNINLAPNGVPYKDAILEIRYKDVINESDCQSYLYGTLCRPFLYIALNFSGNYYLASEPFAGFNDKIWKTKKYFFPNTPFQELRSINGTFEFAISIKSQLLDNTPLPIDYINLTFMDKNSFELSREKERKDRGYNRTEYIEKNTINPIDYPKSYVIYKRNYLEKIYPNTIPKSNEITNSISSFEISGNYEPLTFSLYAFEDLKNISLKISDLSSTTGIISKDNIKIQKVVFNDRRWFSSYLPYFGTNPDYLDDFDSINIPASTSQQFWITVYVPKNTIKGIYTGKITLSGENIEPSEIDISLEVYNINLENPESTPYLYHDPTYSAFSDPRDIALIDMAKHDVYPILYFYPELKLDLKNISNYTLNFSKEYERLMEYKELGALPDKVMIFPMVRSGDDKTDIEIFKDYKKFFNSIGTNLTVSFSDEPGTNPELRSYANHMNKLAKQAGLETWVTYYPECEKPLAGYTFYSNTNDSVVNKTEAPSWILNDKNLAAYWDFNQSLLDKSKNNYSLKLSEGAYIADNYLSANGSGYASNNSVYLPGKNFSFSLWFYINKSANQTGKWELIINSNGWILYQHSGNDYIYFYQHGNRIMSWKPTSKEWHHLACSVVNGTSVTCFGDGIKRYTGAWYNTWSNPPDPSLEFDDMHGLDLLKYFNGSVDDVILFNRTLSYLEILNITNTKNDDKSITLSKNLLDSEILNKKIRFSISQDYYSFFTNKEDFAVKKLLVNNNEVLDFTESDEQYPVYEADMINYLIPGNNNITFIFHSSPSGINNYTIYFLDDFWRNLNWNISQDSPLFNYSYVPDKNGYLAPMSQYLDDRVYAMYYLTKNEAELTKKHNKIFSYYTTFPATINAISYNRFLHGIYPSALGIKDINIYAYMDSYPNYYDTFQQPNVAYTDNQSYLSTGDYNLIYPSWNSEVKDRLVYESLREGIEDSKIIATLKKEIKEHPGAEADNANNYLDSLYSGLKPDYAKNYFFINNSKLPNETEYFADRSKEILYDLSGNSENFNAFDDMRKTIIEYILALDPDTQIIPGDGNGPEDGNPYYRINKNLSLKIANNQSLYNNSNYSITEGDYENPSATGDSKRIGLKINNASYIVKMIIIFLTALILIIILIIITLQIKRLKRKKYLEELSFKIQESNSVYED